MLHLQYLEPKFFFTYPGFDWIVRLPGWGMYGLYSVLGGLSLLLAMGWFPRIAAGLLCLGYSYVFLLDVARYQNHIYLILLLAFIMTLAPKLPNGAWFLRQKVPNEPQMPAWFLYLLRFQIGVVYFFGAVAKWNSDWLFRAEPMATWLARDIAAPDSWLLTWQGMPFVLSWGGMLLDLLMVPALLWRKSRAWAVLAAGVFHGSNAMLFNISIFPPLMFWATLLFLPPNWPTVVLGWLSPKWRQADTSSHSGPTQPTPFKLPHWGATLLALYALGQILIPLRHWVYPGDVNWNEAGHRFSWRMKLREKTGSVKLYWIQDQGSITPLNPEALLDRRQASKLIHEPFLVHQLCQKLAEGLRQKGVENPTIRAVTQVSLNGCPAQPLIELTANLADKYPMGKGNPWVTSLRPLNHEARFPKP